MTYEDMIIEAIISYGEEGRSGLGRPTLKKVILAKHPDTGKLPLTLFSTHLNSAIVRGKDKGVFLLPKGVSGKVKLAAKAKHAAGTSTAPKKTTAPKKAAPTSSSTKKTKSSTSRAASAKKTAIKKAPAKKGGTTKKGTKQSSGSKKYFCFCAFSSYVLCHGATRVSYCRPPCTCAFPLDRAPSTRRSTYT